MRFLKNFGFTADEIEQFERQRQGYEMGLAARVAEYKFLESEVAVHNARKIHQETLYPRLPVTKKALSALKNEGVQVFGGGLFFSTLLVAAPLAILAAGTALAGLLAADACLSGGKKAVERHRNPKPREMTKRQMMEALNDMYDDQLRIIVRSRWDRIKKGQAVAQLQAEYDEAVDEIRRLR